MFVNLNIPSFGELLRKYVYSFRNRLETRDNIIIHGIYLSQLLLQSGISMATRQNLKYAKCSGTTKTVSKQTRNRVFATSILPNLIFVKNAYVRF